jgi:F-type H+-transporting ATPase subunit delta
MRVVERASPHRFPRFQIFVVDDEPASSRATLPTASRRPPIGRGHCHGSSFVARERPMTSRGAATRYARALFDVTRNEHKDLQKTQADLRAFATLVAENPALQRVLINPAIPASRKRGVVEQLLASAGTVEPVVAKTLLMLAERDRMAILADVADVFDSRVMDDQQVVRAKIVTATALPAERLAALGDRLKQATGQNVQIESGVDASLIGGAVARIGGTVYDGSITRQLERMRAALSSTID